MSSRRKEREYTLQALYQCDTHELFTKELIDRYFLAYLSQTPEQVKKDKNKGEFARDLLTGIIATVDQIDDFIGSVSTNWSVARMARVDRNILRLGVYEICFREDIPISVSINESIELAKLYGTEDSPLFVNGVLDKVATVQRNGGFEISENQKVASA